MIYNGALKAITGSATVGGTVRTGFNPKEVPGLFDRALNKSMRELDERIEEAEAAGLSYGQYMARRWGR